MANEKRLISKSERENLIRCLKKLHDLQFTPGIYEHSVIGRAALFLEETANAVEVVHSHWEWFEEWNPSTPDHSRECEDCGWRCGSCEAALVDIVGGYWDNAFEEPKLHYCPNCGANMK